MKNIYKFLILLFICILVKPNVVLAAPEITTDDKTRSGYYKTNVPSPGQNGSNPDFYSTNFFSAYIDLSGTWGEAATGSAAELRTQVYSAKNKNISSSPYIYFWGKNGRLTNDTSKGYFFVKKTAVTDEVITHVPIDNFDSEGREFKGFYIVTDSQANLNEPDIVCESTSNLPNNGTYRTVDSSGKLIFGGKAQAVNKPSAAHWIYATYDYVIDMRGMPKLPTNCANSGSVGYNTKFRVPTINLNNAWSTYYDVTYSKGAVKGIQSFTDNKVTVQGNSGHEYKQCIKNSNKTITFTANAVSTMHFNVNKPSNMSDTKPTLSETSRTIYYGCDTGALPKVSAIGWTFNGWKNANGVYITDTSAASVNTYGGITLNGSWTANTYNIAYNTNIPANWKHSCSGNMSNSTHTYDTAGILNVNTYTCPGLTFKGWNTKSDGSGIDYYDGQQVLNLTSTNGATVNLYAQWEPIRYTVVYRSNGGTGDDYSEVWKYGESHTLFNNTPQLTNTYVAGTEPRFQKQGHFVCCWRIEQGDIIGDTRDSSADVYGDITTNTGYDPVTLTTTSKTTTINFDLCLPTKHDSVCVYLDAHWLPIKYKLQYLNDESIPEGDKGSPYSFAGSNVITEPYNYDSSYELNIPVFSRYNKYGKSTWLGYSTKQGDTSRAPTWGISGITPYESVLNKPLSIIDAQDFKDVSTTDGVSWYDYFKYLNNSDISIFTIYSVYDDCPGFEPVDIQWGAKASDPASITNKAKIRNESTRSGCQAELDILESLTSYVWDREESTTSITSNKKLNYYIDNFSQLRIGQLEQISNTDDFVPTSYKLDYVIKDSSNNTYRCSKKLYVGSTYDIKVGGSKLFD